MKRGAGGGLSVAAADVPVEGATTGFLTSR